MLGPSISHPVSTIFPNSTALKDTIYQDASQEDALTSLPSRQRTQSPLVLLRRPVGTPR